MKPDYPAAALPDKLQGQVIVRVVVDEDGDVESTEVISGNPVLAQAAVDAVKQWKFKPFIRNGQPVKAAIKFPFDFAPPVDAKSGSNQADVPNANFQQKAAATLATKTKPDDQDLDPVPPGTVRVPQVVTQGMVVRRVSPDYPPGAKAMRLQGAVILAAIISKDGTIKDLHVISGHPMLAQAALDAVKQWRYRPYLLDGQPMEVQTKIVVTFSLGGSM